MLRTRMPLVAAGLATVLTAQNPQYALLGNGCAGSMPIARLQLIAPPAIGSLFQVDVTNLPANAAILLTGLSSTTSPLGPLPLQLGTYGMPGCVAHASPDAMSFVPGSGNRASFAFGIPASTGLLGLRFCQQALVPDAAAGNGAGAVVSDAAYAVVGQPGWTTTPIANMVAIPAGSFLMGSSLGAGWEQPVHAVHITRPFWMGRFEVTQAEYQAVMGVNPSWFRAPTWSNSASRPVESVTWNDAVAYCAAVTANELAAGRLPAGHQYRLPTEAEWEYSCRAGTTTEHNTGSAPGCGQANIASPGGGYCVPPGQTAVVGGYAANPWGLHDMHGNVTEWCLDSWDGSANYPAGPVSDPLVDIGALRIYRGGSWSGDASHCRSALRNRYYTNSSSILFGFRVVLAPILVP